MKRVLLFLSFISACGVANAQAISTENFNLLTLGNLSADTSGTTPGQSGYYAYGGATSDYQVAVIDGHTEILYQFMILMEEKLI